MGEKELIYIITISKHGNSDNRTYTGLDTCSDSMLLLEKNILKDILINDRLQIVNAYIHNDNIKIKKWPNRLCTDTGKREKSGSKYVLLATKENGMYKIVDHFGQVSNIRKENITLLAQGKDIANSTETLEVTDVYRIESNEEFIQSIDYKYSTFLAKTTLLGMKGRTFEYEIENKEVRLTKYTGSNADVILPSFITAIKSNAFSEANIKTLKLNEGLKVIGTRALSPRDGLGLIDRIEIPETVRIVDNRAFLNNHKLFKSNGIVNTDRFKLRSNKTIVLWQGDFREGVV